MLKFFQISVSDIAPSPIVVCSVCAKFFEANKPLELKLCPGPLAVAKI